MPGTAGRPRGPSDPSTSVPGQLVNPTGPRARARVPHDSLSPPQALGTGPESPRTFVRHHGPSDLSVSRQGQMVDTKGLWTRAPVARDSWLTPGPRKRTRGAHESWFTPPAFGPGPESPWPAGQPRGLSDPSVSVRGQVVDTEGTRTRAQFVRDIRFTQRGIGHGPESPMRPGQSRRSLDPGPSRQDIGSTLWAHRSKRESSWTLCRHHGPSNQGPSRAAHLVDPAGHRALARVTRDSWFDVGPRT